MRTDAVRARRRGDAWWAKFISVSIITGIFDFASAACDMICSEWLQADVDRCEVHFCARRGVWTVLSQGGHAVRVLIGRNQVNFDRMWVKQFACPASCLSARGKLKTMTEDVSSPVRPVDRSAGRDGFDWWEEEDGQEEGEIQLSRGYYGDKQSAGFPEPGLW